MSDIHPATPMGSPAATTPGQAFYAAYAAAYPYGPLNAVWDELESYAAAAIEAGAEAVAAPLRAENQRLRAALRELAASWAEPVKMATATHDEIVEQVEREECARALLAVLGEASHA